MNRTLSIIKPDATSRNITGEINSIIEKNGLKIIAQKKIYLLKNQAEKFYEIHKEKIFYPSKKILEKSNECKDYLLCNVKLSS